MSHKWLAGLVCLVALAVLFGLLSAVNASAQAVPPGTMFQPGSSESPPSQQERQADPNAPAISFISSPSPSCYRPIPATNVCYIEWSYLQVSASSSQYIISMTVAIDGRMRANYAGFFQTSMYVPAQMHSPGFKVPCGKPGASGIGGMGASHAYTIRAKETGGLSSANYGSVTCPAGTYDIYLPMTARH